MPTESIPETAIAELLAAAIGVAEPDEALDQICLHLERSAPGMRASVLVLDGWMLTCAAAPSLPPAYVRATTGRHLNPGVVSPSDDFLPGLLRDLGLVEVTSAPIAASGGALLGTFNLYREGSAADIPSGIVDVGVRLAACVLERRSLERRVLFEANHDATTGLPNRRRFVELLDGELAAPTRHGSNVTVAALDIDRFRHVNEAMGHDCGDRLLRYAGERLRSAMGEQGIVARTGSDEFAIASRASAGDVEGLLRTALSGPFTVCGREMFVTCAMGVSVSSDQLPEAAELLQQAEAACHRASKIGPNEISRFRMNRRQNRTQDFDIEQRLRQAFAGSELEVLYQPIVRASGGVEALLACGQLAPRDFIRVAEVSGIIVPIGAWVLENSCNRAAHWNSASSDPMRLAVNVSAVQLAAPGFVRTVCDALEHSGLAPNLLELEITESVLMRDVEQSVRQMSELRQLGVRLAIDDFGTGYSSLNYLRLLPATAVKIDQSFVRDLPGSAGTVTVVRSVVSLAHSLGLEVVAEGVETQRQFELLLDAGCDSLQGHLLGRPLPASEIEHQILACT